MTKSQELQSRLERINAAYNAIKECEPGDYDPKQAHILYHSARQIREILQEVHNVYQPKDYKGA